MGVITDLARAIAGFRYETDKINMRPTRVAIEFDHAQYTALMADPDGWSGHIHSAQDMTATTIMGWRMHMPGSHEAELRAVFREAWEMANGKINSLTDESHFQIAWRRSNAYRKIQLEANRLKNMVTK